MTTTTAPVTLPDDTPWPPFVGAPGIPARRLLRAEMRKQVDTTGSRWLLAGTLVASLATLTATALSAPAPGPGLDALLAAATLPQVFLVPVLGVLAVTTEWAHRTAAWTFSHEPRRGRVLLAKAASAVVITLGLLAVTVAAAVVVTAVSHGPATSAWALGASTVADLVLRQVLLVLMGVGFGAALRSAPLAIAATVILPLVWTALAAAVPALAHAAPWLDVDGALATLGGGPAPTLPQWEHLAATTVVWIVAPLLVGAHRLRHDDL